MVVGSGLVLMSSKCSKNLARLSKRLSIRQHPTASHGSEEELRRLASPRQKLNRFAKVNEITKSHNIMICSIFSFILYNFVIIINRNYSI